MILYPFVAALLFAVVAAACGGADDRRGAEEDGLQAGEGFVLQPGEGEVLRMGGAAGGEVIIKVDPGKTGSPQMAMGVQRLEGEIPVHLHEQEEEFLFIHSGEGVGTLGEESVPVKAGTTIYVPPGTWHGVRNTGGEPAEIVWVVTPGAGETTQLEKFFREVGEPPATEPKSLTPGQFVDVMKKHGMRVKSQ